MKNYDPTKYGAVVAIRIYLKDGHQPMAELAFAFGGRIIVGLLANKIHEKDIDVLVGSKFPIENNKEHTFLEIK